jgi:hypothetical protein
MSTATCMGKLLRVPKAAFHKMLEDVGDDNLRAQ